METGTIDRQLVEVRGNNLLVSPDDPVPDSSRLQSIVKARLIDDITDEPLKGHIHITTDTAHLTARISTDGIVGLAGRPSDASPGVAGGDYVIEMRVEVEGYLPYTHRERFPLAGSSFFREVFHQPPWREIRLHRQPVVLEIDTFEESENGLNLLDGVELQIIHVCRAPNQTCRDMASPPMPLMISLLPGLYGSHASGAQVSAITMNEIIGEDHELLDPAASDQTVLRLSDSFGLSDGDIIRIEIEDTDKVEYIGVLEVRGSGSDHAPAWVHLDHPLAYHHASRTLVRRVIPVSPGTMNAFDDNGYLGDVTVFLASSNALIGADTVATIEAGKPPEYYRPRFYRGVSSGVTGYHGLYRFPPISRVDSVRIRAFYDDGTNPPVEQIKTVSIDYSQPVNHVSFVFP